ncbi:hypothetical protein EZ428_21915 [Pedobacter frigiditerrae]|uniref:Uncharacterized protein n=1 Tax=Pedobacter frigiditerrae TaxID=2530452 RepID=A0A4V2MHP5_9SPHI|nr:hypothetical protein [Pedobacter frigiditerrae]TCC87356.1 hypothetical protein EZ428_21915 [Pedobacter frigiditerrae]
MKKLQTTLLLFLLSFQIAFSQIKKIEGDTAYWFKSNKEFQKTLNLKDLEKSPDEFNFRFRNHGQIIEITKDSSSINGNITNYIYHKKKANRDKTDTLFSKITLSPEQAKSVYNIILNSRILNLPSDNKIEDWKKGADGITYTIEHSDKKTYWLKSYWTPTSQGSIPEALIILNFIKNLSDKLNLQETYTTFKNDLPKNGCYNSGGIGIACYISNSLELGYSGANRLPFGFYTSYNASFIGKMQVNSGIGLQYNFDKNGFQHLNLQTSKWNIFYKKSNFSDFIAYNYQNRKLDIDKVNNRFQNHQIKYGLNLKNNFGLGAGLDYLINGQEKIGPHLYAFKWFSKLKISTILTSSIFDNQINYKAEILKSINLNYKSPIHRITTGLVYEDFMDYKDLYFRVQVSF